MTELELSNYRFDLPQVNYRDVLFESLLSISGGPKIYITDQGLSVDSEGKTVPVFTVTFHFHRQHRRQMKLWRRDWNNLRPIGIHYAYKNVSHAMLKDKCGTNQIVLSRINS